LKSDVRGGVQLFTECISRLCRPASVGPGAKVLGERGFGFGRSVIAPCRMLVLVRPWNAAVLTRPVRATAKDAGGMALNDPS